MRKGLIAIAVLAMIVVASVSTSFAYERGCKKSKGHYGKFEDRVGTKAHMILKNKDELGLSDEQVKKIKDLKLKSKKESIKQNADIEIIALDIKAKMWEDAVDTETVNALIDKKYELKKAKAKSSMATYAELKSILTKKQKDSLKEIYKKHKTEKE